MVNILSVTKLFLAFLPLSFVIGPVVFEIFIIGAIILLLFKFKIIEVKRYLDFIKIFFFFNIILISISLFSIDIIQSLKSTVFLFRFAILSIIVAFIFDNYKSKDNQKIFFFFSFIIFLFLVDSLVQIKFGYNLVKFELIET